MTQKLKQGECVYSIYKREMYDIHMNGFYKKKKDNRIECTRAVWRESGVSGSGERAEGSAARILC